MDMEWRMFVRGIMIVLLFLFVISSLIYASIEKEYAKWIVFLDAVILIIFLLKNQEIREFLGRQETDNSPKV